MRYLFILLINIAFLHALSCDKKFTFKVLPSDNISYVDILDKVSNDCNFSIMIKDDKAAEILNHKVKYLKANNFNVQKTIELILSDNLFFNYKNNLNLLEIRYFSVESFYIDYLSFDERKSENSYNLSTSSGSGSSSSGGGGLSGGGATAGGGTSGGGGGSSGVDTKSIKYNSSFKLWQKLEEEIKFILDINGGFTNDNEIYINQEAGLITVKANKQQLLKLDEYLIKLTKRLHKQILLETKIIQVTMNSGESTGIDWSKFDLSFDGEMSLTNNFSLLSDPSQKTEANSVTFNGNLNGLLQFLSTQGDVDVVSSPSILTLNNQPAIINVGETVNFRFDSGTNTTTTGNNFNVTTNYRQDSRFVGVTLDITPEISEYDEIILKINPTISNISNEHFGENGERMLAPDMEIKQLSTLVKVKNGENILIGGLITNSTELTSNKVQILGDIPVLSYLFKNDQIKKIQKEIIILIVPKIIEDETYKISDTITKTVVKEEYSVEKSKVENKEILMESKTDRSKETPKFQKGLKEDAKKSAKKSANLCMGYLKRNTFVRENVSIESTKLTKFKKGQKVFVRNDKNIGNWYRLKDNIKSKPSYIYKNNVNIEHCYNVYF